MRLHKRNVPVINIDSTADAADLPLVLRDPQMFALESSTQNWSPQKNVVHALPPSSSLPHPSIFFSNPNPRVPEIPIVTDLLQPPQSVWTQSKTANVNMVMPTAACGEEDDGEDMFEDEDGVLCFRTPGVMQQLKEEASQGAQEAVAVDMEWEV